MAHWHFDEGSGNTAYDSSGNNNNGMIHGANWTSGVSGYALSFDGIDDYVSFPNLPLSNPSYITVNIMVHNNGLGNASNVNVVFYINSTYVG